VPIYDYICASCKARTEVIHRIDAPGPRFCPACGAEGTMHKALTTPAIHFKGSGWAKKDRSSSSSARTRATAASGDGGDGATKASEGASAAASEHDGGASAGGTDAGGTGGGGSGGGGGGRSGSGSGGGAEGGSRGSGKTTKRAGGSTRSDEG
jgi:putative FmdB family regulatory protein